MRMRRSRLRNGRYKPLKEARHEEALFRRRALAGFLIIVASLVALGARFSFLQIERHDEFSARSEANRVLTRPLAPARGLIYARNGDRIAFNDNSAIPSLTNKCNTARSHEFGLTEDDCRVTQFLLDMVHQAVPELTCKG